jgi:hypothetical protein
MAEVTDPDGVRWSVRRRRWYDMSDFFAPANDTGGFLAWLLSTILLAPALWPFWFIAHWLGLPWRVVIERDSKMVNEEQVRGWRKSRQRIHELTELAAAGTLQQP